MVGLGMNDLKVWIENNYAIGIGGYEIILNKA
jgi:hypothetical protein